MHYLDCFLLLIVLVQYSISILFVLPLEHCSNVTYHIHVFLSTYFCFERAQEACLNTIFVGIMICNAVLEFPVATYGPLEENIIVSLF